MRYVWHADGWQAPAEAPWRDTFIRADYRLPSHYRRHKWGFWVRRWLLAEEIEWSELTTEEQVERSRPGAAFMAQVRRDWTAYDRSVGAWIRAHAESESGYVPGVHKQPVEDPVFRLYGRREELKDVTSWRDMERRAARLYHDPVDFWRRVRVR